MSVPEHIRTTTKNSPVFANIRHIRPDEKDAAADHLRKMYDQRQ